MKESIEREKAVRADFVELNKKFDALQAQVGYNPLTKIFVANGNANMKLDFDPLIKFLKNVDNP